MEILMTNLINLFKSRKIRNIIIVLILVYVVSILISQQAKLNEYEDQKKYYSSKISSLLEEQEELKEQESKINSPEFIEEQAREKLDMYYPNERVYIVQGN